MNKYDACKILNLSGDVNPETVKQAYRRASMQYHPDRNSAGLEMMKAVNAAYEFLKGFNESITLKDSVLNYGDDLFAAINAVINLPNVAIEVCGAWLWVSGETYPLRETLKNAGFKWSKPKKSWYFRPEDYRSFSKGSYSMDEIRAKYGSREIESRTSNRLVHA